MDESTLTPAQKYARSEKGKAAQKKIRESAQNKKLRKEWRARGGQAAEYQRNKDKYRDTYMKRVYGVSLEEYEAMSDEQNGLCYICNQPPTSEKRLAIDHCHDSGRVRRLLCTKCNTALGLLNENVDIMKKLIHYVEEHK
jgi:hypothetical protein